MQAKPSLRKVYLGDYSPIRKSKYVKIFGLMRNLPRSFYKECLSINSNSDLYNFLNKINFVFNKHAGKKGRNAVSFKESRFLTAREILKRKVTKACGSRVTIFASVLRKKGIPVKLVHGKIRGSTGESRHAWLKIYNPLNKKWIITDVSSKGYSLPSKAYSTHEYLDWSELKKDYKRGKW